MLQLGVFTTRELTSDGHEYESIEQDERGEQKVDANGGLLGGREYRIRTFRLAGRGEKLFMLGAECAKELGYRDSYLLFNKNKNLYKILCHQDDKDQLISMDLLPSAFRTRAIAIVTARSVFRQFGSRVIKDGRRVRDDYWEKKAIEQGFTEHDPVIADRSAFTATAATTTTATKPATPEIQPHSTTTPSDAANVNQPLLLGGVFIPGSGINGSIDFHEPDSVHHHRKTVSTSATIYEAQHNVSQFNHYINEQRNARNTMWSQFWSLRQQQRDHLLENGVRELLGNFVSEDQEESLQYQQQYQQIQQSLIRPSKGFLEGPPIPVYQMPDPPSLSRQQQQTPTTTHQTQQRPQPTQAAYSQYTQQLQKMAYQQQQQRPPQSQPQPQWSMAPNSYY
jgi:hypothetical protein